jgi:hypothetical protein
MPYAKIKHADGSYSVINSETGKVHAEKTTDDKADAQLRIMRAYDAGDPIAPRKRPRRRHG